MVLHYIQYLRSVFAQLSFFFLCRSPPILCKRNNLQDSMVRTLSAEELARDVEGFTSHDDDLLTSEQLLCHGAGQATKEVSLAVNDDL